MTTTTRHTSPDALRCTVTEDGHASRTYRIRTTGQRDPETGNVRHALVNTSGTISMWFPAIIEKPVLGQAFRHLGRRYEVHR